MTQTQPPTLVLRAARADEGAAVRRLAQLDDAPAPRGEILLAVLDGEPVAALSLLDGRVVANPFVRTADVVALLRLRAAQLSAAAPGSGSRSRPGRHLGDNRRYPTVISRAA
jgi:hypothetical protein